MNRRFSALILAIFLMGLGDHAQAQDAPKVQISTPTQQRFITLASTTSTENSGLFGYLLPLFQADTGIEVRVVAVGSGQALALAAKGDADAVLAHDRPGEDELIAKGHAIDRRDVMYNDFVLIGPRDDPAHVRGTRDVKAAFKQIQAAKTPFASRGDDSGTHRMELRFWKADAIDVKADGGGWYKELGSGMGATLNTASALGAYVLADRATWAAFKNRGALEILLEGDLALLNPYGSLRVNPAKGAHIKAEEAQIWHEWLTSERGRAAITSFKIDGEQLFFLPDQMPRS